jgi:signal transduction histidine kinase/CheY-like chemotaxis protein/HPt (histidine-containing phosphotransfer) domain-containing protein
MEAPLLSPEQRRRVLSTFRLKLILTSFVLLLLIGMSAMTVVLVTRIFDSLTPAARADLGWKAERGAAELARATELGIVVADEQAIRTALGAYLSDRDITAIVVTDRDGKRLVTHGSPPERLFSGAKGRSEEREGVLVAWAESAIEGETIGRVAVVVSKARLLAGKELQRDILTAAGGGCAVAFTICLFFVSFYVGPLIRVTRLAFERLEATTAQAVEAARLKSEFLANMSHEIRTPMNGIIGMTELLLGTAVDSRQQRYGQTIQTSANALLNVLNDVLDFAKVEAGKLDIHVAECDARRTVEEVAELLSAQAQTKGVELAVHIAHDVPPLVRCDRERIRQILTNIAGNAVKFTEHGEVVLRLDVERMDSGGPILVFRVDDTGPGIDKAQQSRLFEAFYQVDGSLTRRHGGTGLGLAISKQLVTMMGGSISVESELGKGSSFRFAIPVERSEKSFVAEPQRWPDLAALVVDDNPTNLAILQDLLCGWGMRVTSTTRGNEALNLLVSAEAAGTPFELAVIDYQMPGMHGGELAHRIRKELGLEALPIVMLASLGASELRDVHGVVTETLTKPVRQSELRRTLGFALGARTQQPEKTGRTSPTPVQDRARKAPRFAGNPRLLVAEDNPINQEVLLEVLAELGCSADVVGDGQSALDALAKRDYPVVLMDCQMPVLDGYEAVRRLRLRPGPTARTPVVAVTAHAVDGERAKAISAGMDDYIAKPVTIAELAALLQRWLPNVEQVSTIPAPPHDSERALDPDRTRSGRVVDLFLKLAPEQVETLLEAITVGDLAHVKATAHKLRGSSLSIGAPRMARLCGELETHPMISGLAQEIVTAFDDVRRELGRNGASS